MALPSAYLQEFSEPDGYLEFASIGPVSRRVREAVDELLAALEAPAGHAAVVATSRLDAALATMAAFAGVAPDRITPIGATSIGLFQVAFGLLGAGGNVVLPAHEFPANVYPWLRAEAVGGPAVRLVDIDDLRVVGAALADAIDGETRAVAASLVDFRSGFRVDVEELRAVAGDALLVIDGIQGIGAVAQQLEPADVLVAGGQKWLRAGFNSGFMAVSDTALERLASSLTGWWGVHDRMETDVQAPHDALDSALRFNLGTPAITGAVQTAAAIELITGVGIDAVAGVVAERAATVEEALRSAGCEVLAPWRHASERAGIVTFRMPGATAEDTAARLDEAAITVSVRSGWLRAAPHATTIPGIDALLKAAL